MINYLNGGTSYEKSKKNFINYLKYRDGDV